MRSFDILDLQAPLFGDHLLEASAGTGKTFAIEHLVVRLLLEAPEGKEPLQISQILAITFTKAATREMRARIRANLAKTLQILQGSEEPSSPYLRPHLGSNQARRLLKQALVQFDQAQIFTIHGFCQRILQEFALEAHVCLPEDSSASFREQALSRLLDFLETEQLLSSEQLGCLLAKTRGSLPDLCDQLLDAPSPLQAQGSFATDCADIEALIHQWPYEPVILEVLQQEFERLQPFFKVSDFKEAQFEEQIRCLARLFADPTDRVAFRGLLLRKGSIFRFLHPENRKKAKQELLSSPCFDRCRELLLPHLEKATDPKQLFSRLRFAWQQPFEELLEERGLISPDILLQRVRKALDYPAFCEKIRNKIRAVIIDEFQDTDALQWEIFSTLFFDRKRPFYLVGDPKQSIYRFRQADLYTYFKARDALGKEAHYSLDTNYRSTPALVSALNTLFDDAQVHPWLILPREGRVESYRSVKAGIEQEWDPGDEKGALHFFSVSDLTEQTLFYIAQEIERLRPILPSYSSFAVLVKDRMQAEAVQACLQAHALPCWTKNQSSLGESLALSALEELFEALYFPRDSKRLLAGPFATVTHSQLFEWKTILDREGLPTFLRVFTDSQLQGKNEEFVRDCFQIIEHLLLVSTPSLETLKRVFRKLENSDPDEDPSLRRRMESDEQAIQIMTMHGSKGLEFDVVFAIGVAQKTPLSEEEPQENHAEKLRQLYVAFTRAKLRLYVPLLQQEAKAGTESPLELFWRQSKLSKDPWTIAQKLIDCNARISLESVGLLSLQPRSLILDEIPLVESPRRPPLFPERGILSFTSMSRPESGTATLPPIASEEKTLHTLPRGTDTGVVLHKIFERIFTEKQEPSSIVKEELRLGSLQPWENALQLLVKKTLSLPLFEDASSHRSEVEFLFVKTPHFYKGFIDLVFLQQGRFILLDWKTNWLGDKDFCYLEPHLRKAMDEGDYWLQASLYKEALQRGFPTVPIGGIFYLFLRGVDAPGNGVLQVC